jgi:ATP-dependent DNA helicase RecG
MRLRSSYKPSEFSRLTGRESDVVEKKSGLGQRAIQEALVAMSNSQGGVIFVGVQDDGTVVGRRHEQGVDDRIHEAALAVQNVGRYRITQVEVGDKPVVAIEVQRRVEGFAQTSDGRILVRRGGRNTALFGADLTRFVNERALRRFELTDTGLDASAMAQEFLNEVQSVFRWSDGSLTQRLQERGLLTSDTSNLTVAGALFLTDPGSSLSQNKAVVEVRRYPEGAAEYDRREEFGGPLHHQVADATRFLVEELGSDLIVTGLYRHELPRLPEVVVREAIANAVAHRSYEQQGTPIIVELKAEEVVVTSPGGLPEPVTIENLRQAQSARNQAVIDVLRRFRLAEDAGRGIDVMQDSMEEALLDPPSFDDLGHAVRATLPLRGPITPQERAWVADLERQGHIRGTDRLLLVHAARGERLTNAQARNILAVDRVEARAALHRLRDAGLLQQQGARGGATYSLVEEVAPPAAFRMSPKELERLVVREARSRPLTNEIVREITGLERSEALSLLKRLVQQGRLRRTGQRRGTKYLPRRRRSA